MRDIYATDAQRSYLRRLLNEHFVKHCAVRMYLDPHHLPERMTKQEASRYIGELKTLKANGWKH